MDEDKLKVLALIDYRVLPTCKRCVHSRLSPHVQWGQCSLHHYDHGKHTKTKRNLSIHASGSCPQFSARSNEVLGGFSEFVQSCAPKESS